MKLSLTPAFLAIVGPALATTSPLSGRCAGHGMPRCCGFRLILAGCCTQSSTIVIPVIGRSSRPLCVLCPHMHLASRIDGLRNRDEFVPDGTDTVMRTATGMRCLGA